MANVPVGKFISVAPAAMLKGNAPAHVAVPALFSVRVSDSDAVEFVVTPSPPSAFVVPLPPMVPPVHTDIPSTVTVSVPLSVPPLCV